MMFFKKISILFAGILISLPVLAEGANNKDHSIIHINGMAEKIVPADKLILTAKVDIKRNTATEASIENARILKVLRDNLSRKGFDTTKLTSTNYSLFPQTRYDKILKQSVPDGFRVSHNISFESKALKKAGILADLFISSGVTHIISIQYQPEIKGDTYDNLLKSAVANARKKAEIMMKSAGGSDLRAYYISSHQHNSPVPRPVMMRSYDIAEAGMAKSAPTEITAKDKVLSITVDTKWSFNP